MVWGTDLWYSLWGICDQIRLVDEYIATGFSVIYLIEHVVTIVEEKIWNNLIQAFSDLAWLKKDRWEYHPMFIAIKNVILIHKYCLQVLRMFFCN